MEPLTALPGHVLERTDVQKALLDHDFGVFFALVRKWAGISLNRLGEACDIKSSRMSHLVRGEASITTIAKVEQIADALRIPGHLLRLAPRPWETPSHTPGGTLESEQVAHEGGKARIAEEDGTKRRDAVKLAGVVFGTPAAVTAVLDEAAAEALEFTRRAEASALGSGTLDHLGITVTDLNDAYSLKHPRLLFDTALHYRRKVDQFLDGPHTQRQARELFAYAGWLSELLAWLAHDLGNARAGLAFAHDAYVHGLEAGHGELCAWAMDAAASINLYEQRPAKALGAARAGLAQAPASHPLTVRLNAQAARASAANGDAEGFQSCFSAAREAHESLPARVPHCFGTDPLPLADYALTSYPATACVWLGQAEQARQYAEDALEAYQSAAEASRSPSREAIARIDLALALAQLGSPDDAVALGHQALDSARLVGSVLGRAGDLVSFLARRYPSQGPVQELRERLAVTTAVSSHLPSSAEPEG
ncbi:helix-turn-helix domain-containing protein [Streptomyces sp. URMC 129]|uniref:helix-turn-helix domain-containing protein n=1 Tax=Streptomyces sp. URMC 129 TaxID=3423407 RepID=UPI003F1CC056